MVVPVNQIAHYVTYIKEISEGYDFEVKSFGHAGDGNLHIYTCSNDMELAAFEQQVADFMEKAYAKATELGGLISGEHGIGHGQAGLPGSDGGPGQHASDARHQGGL